MKLRNLVGYLPSRWTGEIQQDFDALVSSLANIMRRHTDGPDVNPWTPVLTFATPGDLAVTYTTQRGAYAQSGGLITADFDIVTSVFTHTTAAGVVQITGLPAPAINDTGYVAVGTMQWGGITKATYTHCAPVLSAGSVLMGVNAFGSGVAPAQVAFGDMPTGGTVRFRGMLIYRV